jgi:hypothetical protein
MPENEQTHHIRPDDSQIGKRYVVVFPQVCIRFLVTEGRQTFLRTANDPLREGEKIIATRRLDTLEQADIPGYTTSFSQVVFNKEGGDKEFIMPNAQCLDHAPCLSDPTLVELV